ncbi:ABC transporter ATP-binding protein [Fundicoccus culcitae]|uniref:ABC transporter ATP-binding protein n=1 Tax=Fundicoccus culcitae TaxID=2969821 RepID=A0ABY5P6K5_9LACT|nr:ABC transporter ATP-binding protein [Fundicoccus culcitae]UUX34240.1 ABC transporter ATP-binding protein [Fundicoccus culcitae]
MIELKNINKAFGSKAILVNVNLNIESGEMIALIGQSGSGKSTLLNIIGLIEPFDSGELIFNGIKNIKVNSSKSQAIIRDHISYLFQNYALVDNETVYYNLELALKYAKKSKNEKNSIISNILMKVGLADTENKKIYELSGGEQQRIAIARAFIKPSDLVLADEPTGSLDAENRDNVLKLIIELNKSGKTVIIVTHDNYVAQACSRIVDIHSIQTIK